MLPQHERLITGSAIAPEVSAARGYRSITKKTVLKGLGFSDQQSRVPGLLVPIYNTRGELGNYQFRSDEPRIKDGKPIKYETPAGSRMLLDVPPTISAAGLHRRGDSALWITEGSRKADAGVSAGLVAIALPGVWNWRGTNEVGGKTALPDWEDIHLPGRDVYIVFDSDVSTKAQVAKALVRLKGFLEGRGANVRVVYLPDAPNGAKQGLDDFLAAGHGVAELLAFATPQLREPPDEDPTDTSSMYFTDRGYTGHEGRFSRIKSFIMTGNGFDHVFPERHRKVQFSAAGPDYWDHAHVLAVDDQTSETTALIHLFIGERIQTQGHYVQVASASQIVLPRCGFGHVYRYGVSPVKKLAGMVELLELRWPGPIRSPAYAGQARWV